MSENKIAVIDFGTSKIVTLVTQGANSRKTAVYASGVAAYDGFQDTKWMVPRRMVQRVHASIAMAEKELGEAIKEIYVGVPGGFLHVQTCTVRVESEDGEDADTLKDALMDKAAEELGLREAGNLVLHRCPAWFCKDEGEREIQPQGICHSLEGEVSFVTVLESFVEDISEMMGVLGITILGFVSSNLGADMQVVRADDRDKGAVVIDCGYLNTDVSVVSGDAMVYHAVLPIGGGHITADLATDLQIRMREAEKIKREFVLEPNGVEREDDVVVYAEDDDTPTLRFKRAVIAQTVEKTLGEWCDMVTKTFNNDLNSLLSDDSKVILTGGGIARMRDVAQYVADRIGREVDLCTLQVTRLNTPEYVSVYGTMDIVMDALAIPQDEESPKGRGLKKLFHR